MSLRLVLVAQEAAGARILKGLLSSPHEVVAVLQGGSEDSLSRAPLSQLASEAGIPTAPAQLVRDPSFAERIRGDSVDLLINANALEIAVAEVLAAPSMGCFNLHPGPLPEYAGLNTVGWAIYEGAVEYGVSLHWMEPGIDTGPIALEERFRIDPNATALTLSAECTRRGVPLVFALLDAASRGVSEIPVVAQDLSRRRYFSSKDVPSQGRASWEEPGADLLRLARAFDYGPFPCPWGRLGATIAGTDVQLAGLAATGESRPTAVQPGEARLGTDGALWVACRDEWLAVPRVFKNRLPVEPTSLL